MPWLYPAPFGTRRAFGLRVGKRVAPPGDLRPSDAGVPPEKPSPTPPITAPRYELRKVLGHGGMGVVYEALDTRTGGLVAVKTMRDISDPRTVEMFRKEWAVLARLSHPNIVDIRDVDEVEEDGKRRPCFVMPLLPGVTLAKLIQESSPRLTVSCVLGIINHVCSGLQAAHKEDLFHRDLKPSNIFVMEDNTAKIIDFGVVYSGDSNSIIGYKGTWQYMAPEQTEGKEPNARSDIFSLGVVAYEALTGRKPFQRATVQETVEALRHCTPASVCALNPKVSQPVGKAIHKAIAKHPQQRYASARDFAETLQKAYRNEPIESLDMAAIEPRLARARKAFNEGDWEFAEDVLAALETEGNFDSEITLLRAQIDESKKQRLVQQLYKAAKTRFEQDELSLALDKVREILSLDPNNQDALAMRDRAEAEREKQDVSRWVRLACEHRDNLDFQEARQALEEALHIRSNDPEASRMLAELDDLEKKAAAARANKEQLYGSALRAFQNGEISTALSKMQKILDVNHGAPAANFSGRDATYQTFYEQVRAERDRIERAYEEGVRQLAQRNFAQALFICDQILAENGRAARFQALKLRIEQAEGQELSFFVAQVGKAAENEPDLSRRIAILEEASTRYPKEDQLQRSLKLAREQRDLVVSIALQASQYEERGQYAEAIAQWEILHNVHPGYPDLVSKLEQLELRRHEQALSPYKDEQRERPGELVQYEKPAKDVSATPPTPLLGNPNLEESGTAGEADRLFEEARSSQANGYLAHATRLLQSALKLDPSSTRVRLCLVSLLVKRAEALLEKDWAKAEALAQSAAAIDPTHPAVQRMESVLALRKQKAQTHLKEAQRAHSDHGAPIVEGASKPLSAESPFDPENRSDLKELTGQEMMFGDSLARTRVELLPSASSSEQTGRPFAARSQAPVEPQPAWPVRAQANYFTSFNSAALTQVSRFMKSSSLAMNNVAALSKLSVSTALGSFSNSARHPYVWGGIIVAAAVGITVMLHFSNLRVHPRIKQTNADVNVLVPVTVVPEDAIVSVNGLEVDRSTKSKRLLRLSRLQDYSVTVSRLGFRTEHHDHLNGRSGSEWIFHLEPETLKISVYTAAVSGTVMLDAHPIGNLEHGELLDYEMSADGHNHTIAARDENGELFSVDFQPEAGKRPNIAPIRTKQLIVAGGLGRAVTVFSGTQPQKIALQGQNGRDISNQGTDLQIQDSASGPQILIAETSKKQQQVMIAAENSPRLVISFAGDPDAGSIAVKTAIEGAHLFADGLEVRMRTSGYWHFPAKPGDHKLRLVAEGFGDSELAVQVAKGKLTMREVQLLPAAATFSILGGTPGSSVLIDGKLIGSIDLDGLYTQVKISPGTHEIKIQKDNFEPLQTNLSFSAGQEVKVPGVLREFGSLVFDIEPSQATVKYRRIEDSEWQNGSASGLVRVKSGRYEVLAAASGLESASQDFFVSTGGTQTFKIALRSHSRAIVTAPPAAPATFFAAADRLTQVGGWLTGKDSSFIGLKPGLTNFTLLFLGQNKAALHRRKRAQWTISLYPDRQIAYELDGEQLVRKLRVSGNERKAIAKGNSPNQDLSLVVRVTLKASGVEIRTEKGDMIDNVKDEGHDWSKATVAIKGDSFFLVRAHS